MDHLSSQIDDKTAAVIVNSPSNPCGGVFSLEHIQQIIDVCDKHKVPIISDEVYEHVVSYAFYVLIPRISTPVVITDSSHEQVCSDVVCISIGRTTRL